MGFADSVRAWTEKALDDADNAVNKVVSSLFTEVVERSPMPLNYGGYATGHMKNQWMTASGVSPSSEVGSSASETGSESLARIQSLVAEGLFFRRDNIVTLTNNTQQASYAEKGWVAGQGTNGWVWKGSMAYAMVSLSVLSTKNKFG